MTNGRPPKTLALFTLGQNRSSVGPGLGQAAKTQAYLSSGSYGQRSHRGECPAQVSLQIGCKTAWTLGFSRCRGNTFEKLRGNSTNRLLIIGAQESAWVAATTEWVFGFLLNFSEETT
jgi:hypothetical protein